MDNGAIPLIGIVYGIFLLTDIVLYGFGAAIQNLSESDILKKAEETRDRKSIRILRIMQHPKKYVNTVQMITTVFHMLSGAIFLFGVQRLRRENILGGEVSDALAVALCAAAVLYIFLTFGVLLPKQVAKRIPEKWTYFFIGPVWMIVTILAPFTWIIHASVCGILFLCGIRKDSDDADVTEEEIINMVQEGFEQGVIEDSEAEMISNIFSYGDKEAQDIMTHRSNVVAVDGNMHLKEAIDFMLAGTNSRYPVYLENLDHIIGVLHLKDAMRYHRRDAQADGCVKDLEGLLREAHFVPQTKNIDELFEEMQSRKLQMVIVVDEYGQMDGLVAMEDILEEIVGNILDEYDEDTKYIQKSGEDEYVIEGKTPLEDLSEKLGIDFSQEYFETLNGFMIARLDHIPEEDEQFEVDFQGYNFKILKAANKMVQSVLVTRLPGAAEEEGEPSSENRESPLDETEKK